jgi:hypothetical protein
MNIFRQVIDSHFSFFLSYAVIFALRYTDQQTIYCTLFFQKNFVNMWLFYSLFIYLIISIDGTKWERELSSVDSELISFGHSSLMKYFRHDDKLHSTHIIRIKSGVSKIIQRLICKSVFFKVDLETSRQIFTIDFQVVSIDNNLVSLRLFIFN